ncbi:MAG: T9SS type A sorting domain-containing protein [Sporocytophaga sp.]|uniref:T9SS type A sorting domain-containing protein n=1 Tax=Sporocytophaga sp. TaxID=2231183 RepID=UPI001B199305|nr:T9SS type A sorting domain-containing protein [Sporocytophaga sp.]MBO9700115.1 T9SS type A sorting domain-containing protein [Sporocytophaga sp.]
MLNPFKFDKKIVLLYVFFYAITIHTNIYGQSFSFSNLKGVTVLNPTSLQFGPDGKLYVSQQDGIVQVFTIQKNGPKDYTAIATEKIDLVKKIPNHNDDGQLLVQTASKRQVTGLLVAGTADSPLIYVTSSDYRMGAASAGDMNLCTNSGILSKLYKEGNVWKKIDLVRGLPRSEENHAPNGMQLYNGKIIMIVGGFTNAGAPSMTFTYIGEYALSAAVLSIDLNAIEAMPLKVDESGQNPYRYDIPTLDDPTRPNKPDGTDVNDPWGGNNGLNQAKIVPNGPVKIFATGFRAAYDILITTSATRKGRIYSIDNGANRTWGGSPVLEPDGVSYTNKYPDGEPGSSSVENLDGLEYIGHVDSYIPGSYYAGHPNPIRANPKNAGWHSVYGDHKGWRNDNSDTSLPLPIDWPPVPLDMANPQEGEFYNPGTAKDKGLIYFNTSTNGLCEYTYTKNPLYGDILAACFDGTIARIKLDDAGNVLNSKTANRVNLDKPFASGFGDKPLDIIAQGDDEPFEGTVWIATYGSHTITILEPEDVVCTGDTTDHVLDDDKDGFSNYEENISGTDPCNAVDKPSDTDNDGISDNYDEDDDNDNVKDILDIYALDSQNGLTTTIPTHYNLFNNDPGTGLFGLGFTGLMSNGKDAYNKLFDPDKIVAGGAVGALTVEEIPEGDAAGLLNTQKYAFQFGVNVDKNTGPFIIKAGILPNYFNGGNPADYQSHGAFMGYGDQDNYIKIVYNSNGGKGGIQVLREANGISDSLQKDLPEGGVQSKIIIFYFAVDPSSGIVFPKYEVDKKIYSFDPIKATGKLLGSIQKSDTALAVGIIATSNGSGKTFSATWDYIEVVPGIVSSISQWHDGNKSININLYPNPSRDLVNLNINEEGGKKYTIKIYNNLSQMISEKAIYFDSNSKDYSITVSDYPDGVYYFQIIPEGADHSATLKFIKN